MNLYISTAAMLTTKLALLLLVTSVVVTSASFVVAPEYNNNMKKAVVVATQQEQNNSKMLDVAKDASNRSGNDWDTATIHGIPLKYLTKNEIKDLLDDEDNIIASELDIIVAKKVVTARKNDAVAEIHSKHPNIRHKRLIFPVGPAIKLAKHIGRQIGRIRIPNIFVINTGNDSKKRHKRWVGIAARLLSAGRNLFRGAARAPKPTVSGNRVTQQYTRPGTYNDAVRDFNRFQPDNLRSFNKNGISGQTGTVGNHRFTVRDGSKQGSPTLEIRSPRPNGEQVRKFRYNQK